MCCIRQLYYQSQSKTLREKLINLLVQRLFYRFFMVVCIVESLLFQPHPHKKNHVHKVLEGEKNIRQMHTSRKNSRQMNGLKKNSCLQQFTQPSPPLLPLGPSEVKLLAPKCVWTSFMKRTLVVRFLQGATSSKQPLNLIILVLFLCEVQM